MSPEQANRRPLSGVERLWLTAERIAPPFVNQAVFEAPWLSGARRLTRNQVVEAVAGLLPSVPMLGSCLRGVGPWARWSAERGAQTLRDSFSLDTAEGLVLEVDGGGWTGASGVGAPWLRAALGEGRRPPVSLVIVRGEGRDYLILRTRHAASDGRGTLELAARVFAALRKEDTTALPMGPLTDFELASRLGRSAEAAPEADQPFVLASPSEPDPRFGAQEPGGEAAVQEPVVWARATATTTSGSPLRALIASLSAGSDRALRFDIPVDMRRHVPGLQSSANLTGLIRLEVAPGETTEAAMDRLGKLLDRGAEADFVLGAQRFRALPLWLLEAGGKQGLKRSKESGAFATAGTLSNLGRIEPERYACAEFPTERVYFIPPGSPGLPLFATLTGGPLGVELCLATPSWLLGQEDLSAAAERIVRGWGV